MGKIKKLRHNLYRRLSLRFSAGYSRPPFMLVIHRRPGKKLLSNSQVDRKRAPDIRVYFTLENPGPPPHDYRTACYLWPDRLRWHFWMIAFLIMFPLVLDSAWISALFVALFLLLIIPWFTYSFGCISVLENLWQSWPPFMDEWFKGLVEDASQRLPRMRAYFPPFCERWNAVYWSPQGSPRDSLLRAAINEMFSPGSEEQISWHHKAFRRWIFYWCAPVWGSYLALLLILTPMLFIPEFWNYSDRWWYPLLVPEKKTLYVLVWVWIVFGGIFIWREKTELWRWSGLNKDNRDFVPALIYQNLKDISDFFLVLSEPSVKLVLSLIGTAGISAYLSLVNVIYPQSVDAQKVKEPIKVITLNKSHKEEVTNNSVYAKIFYWQ
jgi:hypothetical protein